MALQAVLDGDGWTDAFAYPPVTTIANDANTNAVPATPLASAWTDARRDEAAWAAVIGKEVKTRQPLPVEGVCDDGGGSRAPPHTLSTSPSAIPRWAALAERALAAELRLAEARLVRECWMEEESLEAAGVAFPVLPPIGCGTTTMVPTPTRGDPNHNPNHHSDVQSRMEGAPGSNELPKDATATTSRWSWGLVRRRSVLLLSLYDAVQRTQRAQGAIDVWLASPCATLERSLSTVFPPEVLPAASRLFWTRSRWHDASRDFTHAVERLAGGVLRFEASRGAAALADLPILVTAPMTTTGPGSHPPPTIPTTTPYHQHHHAPYQPLHEHLAFAAPRGEVHHRSNDPYEQYKQQQEQQQQSLYQYHHQNQYQQPSYYPHYQQNMQYQHPHQPPHVTYHHTYERPTYGSRAVSGQRLLGALEQSLQARTRANLHMADIAQERDRLLEVLPTLTATAHAAQAAATQAGATFHAHAEPPARALLQQASHIVAAAQGPGGIELSPVFMTCSSLEEALLSCRRFKPSQVATFETLESAVELVHECLDTTGKAQHLLAYLAFTLEGARELSEREGGKTSGEYHDDLIGQPSVDVEAKGDVGSDKELRRESHGPSQNLKLDRRERSSSSSLWPTLSVDTLLSDEWMSVWHALGQISSEWSILAASDDLWGATVTGVAASLAALQGFVTSIQRKHGMQEAGGGETEDPEDPKGAAPAKQVESSTHPNATSTNQPRPEPGTDAEAKQTDEVSRESGENLSSTSTSPSSATAADGSDENPHPNATPAPTPTPTPRHSDQVTSPSDVPTSRVRALTLGGGGADPEEERRAFIYDVYVKFRAKLLGRVEGRGRDLSPRELVDRLLAASQSLDVLSSMYEGWMPWL